MQSWKGDFARNFQRLLSVHFSVQVGRTESSEKERNPSRNEARGLSKKWLSVAITANT